MKLKEIGSKNIFERNEDLKALYLYLEDKSVEECLFYIIDNYFSLFTNMSETPDIKCMLCRKIIHTLLENSFIEIRNKVIDSILSSSNYFLANLIGESDNINLTEAQIEKGLLYNNLDVRKSFITNKNIIFTQNQLNRGLFFGDESLKIEYLKKAIQLNLITEEQINKIFNSSDYDEDSIIYLVNRNGNEHINLSEAQVTKGLSHESFLVRVTFAQNYRIDFTPEQIKIGLEDIGFEDDEYSFYSNYDKSDVIIAFIKNPNISLPKGYIDNIIYEKNVYQINFLLEREDLYLTSAQFQSIMGLSYINYQKLLENKNLILKDNDIIKQSYLNPKLLAKYYLVREDIELSELVKAVLDISESQEIKEALSIKKLSLKKPKI